MDLDVKTGETLVILGPSGIGKSVLLKHIIGITKPDEGSILIDDVCISNVKGADRYKAVKNMGMLFQEWSSCSTLMNVEENVSFYLTINMGTLKTGKRYLRKEIADRVAEALEMVGLAGTQKTPSDALWGDEKSSGPAGFTVYIPLIVLI
jgi:phospholipid/cholesterol/gamma-HCH transport system ATP-binding protein